MLSYLLYRLAGSYEALEAGNPAEALVDFTGGVSEYIDLVSGNYANDLEKRKVLFQKLYKYMDRQSMTSASIKVFSNFFAFECNSVVHFQTDDYSS